MTAPRHGVSVTSAGEMIVAGEGWQVVLKLEVEELREMADMLHSVADRLEDAAGDIATAAIAKAQERLQ